MGGFKMKKINPLDILTSLKYTISSPWLDW